MVSTLATHSKTQAILLTRNNLVTFSNGGKVDNKPAHKTKALVEV